MLKGLEVSEVWLSNIVSNVETMRLDSEYHLKEYETIDNFKKTHRNVFCKFSDYGLTIDCSAFYPGIEQFYGTGSNPLIRVQNIKDNRIEYDTCEMLPFLSSDYKTLKWVEAGDIVITKGGSIGFVGYVTKSALASRDLIFIKSSVIDTAFSKYLFLYFSTKFAYKQLIRSSSQVAQPHLTITLVKDFDIFKASDRLIQIVANLYDKSERTLEESKQLYAAAEDQLLSELGLKDWQPKNKNINVKTLKESFLSSGRLDAEYYQSKYDEIEKHLKKHNQTDLLVNVCFVNQANIKPNDKEQYKYIELANINTMGEITGCTIDYGENLPTRARQVVKSGDVIVSSIEGSLDSCALVTPEYDNAFCSTGFYIIRSKIITNETLLVLMKLKPIQQLLKKGCSGTILTAINYDNFCNIIIPIPDGKIQTEISIKIQRCFALKAESKRLLAEAKMMVENEIEKGGE